jgi:SAM-dependent methyltransferase
MSRRVRSKLRGKRGLEIGGPSQIFSAGNLFPLYPYIARLDSCNFAPETVWTAESTRTNASYEVPECQGDHYIAEAAELTSLPQGAYDFVLTSHVLEHVANPLRALQRWMEMLTDEGLALVIVPYRVGTFDHQRPFTEFQHLVEDYRNCTGEDDLTHLEEILALHDLSKDPGAGSRDHFEQRSRNNFQFRCLHHHVFSPDTLAKMFEFAGIELLDMMIYKDFHLIAFGQKRSHR